MTITHNGTTFASTLHGTPVVPPWEFQRSIQRFFGVAGEYQLLGAANARQITIEYEMSGHPSHFDLQTGIAEFADFLGTVGTLVVTLPSSDFVTFTNCTFDGFFPNEAPWYDGSGVNGWQCRGQLRFRQKAGS